MNNVEIERLVVVGASLAGLRAVEAARKSGFAGRITLVGAEDALPYDRPPLSKAFLEDRSAPVSYFCEREYLADQLGVELCLGAAATALDTVGRNLYVGSREIGYDAAVIATGGNPRVLPDAQGLDGVCVLRTLHDAERIRRKLTTGAEVVVVGAGFIGAEIASAATRIGANVTIVEAQRTPLARAVGSLGSAVALLHERNGTALVCGTGVAEVGGVGHVQHVVLDDGRRLPADVVVVGIGMQPATEWLHGSGLHIDDGIVCDATLFTGAAGVYAAGDVANWPNPAFGLRQRMENWTAAADQGSHAARNAITGRGRPYSTVPYFWSDWYGSRIQFVGIADPADNIAIVEGDPAHSDRWIALYRLGDRLVGALTVNGRSDIMKWPAAIDFAERRRIKRLTPAT
ncbi:NAD(P)/FAD-dependent oxidoreductase [Nocardia sp. NPDC052278]|uniref:NAD(P)/FAD-dependent oxidoreductase n=1 Tax=unclassified Nocardia TaxID=2637762 RepID=UPI0036B952DE